MVRTYESETPVPARSLVATKAPFFSYSLTQEGVVMSRRLLLQLTPMERMGVLSQDAVASVTVSCSAKAGERRNTVRGTSADAAQKTWPTSSQ